MGKIRLIPCNRECSECELEVGGWCFGYGTVPSNVLLRRAMEEKGFSETELSEASNLSISTIKRMLANESVGSLSGWMAASKALGVPIDQLVQVKDFADW